MQYLFFNADKETCEILKNTHSLITSGNNFLGIDEDDFISFLERVDRIQAVDAISFCKFGRHLIFTKNIFDVCTDSDGRKAKEAIVFIVGSPSIYIKTIEDLCGSVAKHMAPDANVAFGFENAEEVRTIGAGFVADEITQERIIVIAGYYNE